jgi:hypothetical protein
MATLKVTRSIKTWCIVKIPNKELKDLDKEAMDEKAIELAENDGTWNPPVDYGTEEYSVEKIS